MAVNDSEFRIVGMSRSGNHAIINWILSQIDRRYCFLNCTEGKTNPFLSARPMANGYPYQTNIKDFDYGAEKKGHFSRKDYLVFNHEDNFLANAFSDDFERSHNAFVGTSRRRIDILLLRDPFNLFASRFWRLTPQVSPTVAMKIWKQHAREFLSTTKSKLRHAPLRILYNRWTEDVDYRREITQSLGIPFSDNGIDKVDNCAGGSSFDGTRYDGHAREMRVLERWRRCIDDPTYLRLFDEEVLAMSEAIFGPLPAATEVFAAQYKLLQKDEPLEVLA